MKATGIKVVEELDMFGQQISFWYKGSLVYSTILGIIVSIVISILMLIYSVLFVVDILNADKPVIIEVTEAKDIPLKYFFTSDYPSYFDKNAPYPPNNFFSSTSSIFQMSIGIEDIRTSAVKKYDPSYLSMQALRSSKGDLSESLFYDFCTRFLTEPQETIDYYKLNETLCIFSDFVTEDSFTGDHFKALNITMNVCKNNTWYYEPLEINIEYNLLKRRYDTIFLNKKIDYSDSQTKNFSDNARITKIKTSEPVICKSKQEITNYIKNSRIVVYFINSLYNVTEKSAPITYYLDKKKYSLSSYITQSISLFFKIDVFQSYTGLIPYTLVKSPVTYYYLNFDNDITKYGDFDYDKSQYLLRLYLQSSKIISNLKRVYPNIFTIMGVLGGVSKILMLVFTLFVTKWADYKLKEELINDLYAVIDPHNDELVKLKFTEYMAQRRNKKHTPNKILETVITDEIIDSIWKELDQEKREAQEKKYEIIYEAFKHQAYCGLTYSLKELFLSVFCKCFISKKLKEKNKIYHKAWEKLESDTDFLSIIRALQEFDNIKKFFFDNSQLNIFDSFKNEEIIYDQLKDKDDENNSKIIIDKDEENMKNLENQSQELAKAIDWYSQNKATTLDKKLLLNVLDYQDNIVNSFLNEAEERRKPDQDQAKHDNENKFKPLTDGELKNIIKAFKKN
jgi:hypothetical protein